MLRVSVSVGPIRLGRIEAVVALTCLGLLSVAAVPRYVDLAAANRRTEVRALAASLASAADLGHSLWLGDGGAGQVAIAGAPVGIINGYPSAADLARLLDADGSPAFRFVNGSWSHRERSATGECGVTYTVPSALGEQPGISLQLDGC